MYEHNVNDDTIIRMRSDKATAKEIAEVTNLTLNQVNGSIARLKKYGKIETTPYIHEVKSKAKHPITIPDGMYPENLDAFLDKNFYPFELCTLIEMYNSEEFNKPQMAAKLGVPYNVVRNKVMQLQRNKIILPKDTYGRLIYPEENTKTKPSNTLMKSENTTNQMTEKRKTTEKEISIENIFNTLKTEEINSQGISTYHKELAVEILHRILST